MKSSVVIL
jgi:hypothetical protein